MDDDRIRISSQSLYRQLGGAAAPLLIDVRGDAALEHDGTMIVAARRRAPEAMEQWRQALPSDGMVVLYCEAGATSPRLAASLCNAGIAARWLEGGLAGWRASGLPTRRRRTGDTGRWVTRERPKIDRIACPWLVRRFIDPEARFFYVPSAEVSSVAVRETATPYDTEGAEFGHAGERCSFDAFLRLYAIADAGLDRLALIVRGADTGRAELTAESPLLLALSRHLSERFADDHTMLERGMLLYDALYAWCRSEVAR
jgi:rhodanese-related sulfurtransferase